MTDEQFIQAYPYSIKAWQAQRTLKDVVITGDEKTFYDFEVSEYAYWFNLNRNEELYQKIKELELANAKLRDEKSSLEAELVTQKGAADILATACTEFEEEVTELEKKLTEAESNAEKFKHNYQCRQSAVVRESKKLAIAAEALAKISEYDTCHRCQHYIGSPNKYCEPESKCISNNRSEYLPVSDDKLRARQALKRIQNENT